MSGGSYDYAYLKIEELAFNISTKANPERPAEYARRKAFAAWLRQAAKVASEIEWHDSGDRGPDDEAKAMDAFLAMSPRAEALRELCETAEALRAALAVAIEEAKK